MADGFDKPIMPPKEDKKKLPEAIPVDDKGQPLPDPSENLSGYIVTSGVEHLKKTFASVETDDDVRETMEPPQQTGFFKKHRSGARGYDYYGTPAGSIPKDANGVEPSPLSKLFSEAEVLEENAENEPVEPKEKSKHLNRQQLKVHLPLTLKTFSKKQATVFWKTVLMRLNSLMHVKMMILHAFVICIRQTQK